MDVPRWSLQKEQFGTKHFIVFSRQHDMLQSTVSFLFIPCPALQPLSLAHLGSDVNKVSEGSGCKACGLHWTQAHGPNVADRYPSSRNGEVTKNSLGISCKSNTVLLCIHV